MAHSIIASLKLSIVSFLCSIFQMRGLRGNKHQLVLFFVVFRRCYFERMMKPLVLLVRRLEQSRWEQYFAVLHLIQPSSTPAMAAFVAQHPGRPLPHTAGLGGCRIRCIPGPVRLLGEILDDVPLFVCIITGVNYSASEESIHRFDIPHTGNTETWRYILGRLIYFGQLSTTAANYTQ